MDQTPQTPDPERRARADERVLRFLEVLATSGALPGTMDGWDAACDVFAIFLQRVSGGQAGDFAGSLPEPLKAMLLERVAAREESPEIFDRDEFFARVARHFELSREEAARLARVVLAARNAHLPTPEVDDVGNQLPPDLEKLWRHPEK